MRGFVATEFGRVHYRTAGSSGPVITLFHESPLSSRVYDQVIPLLAERARVYAFDTPGYGLSDPPAAPVELPAYASRLLAAIDALGIGPFAVAGGHTGAELALEIAIQTDRVTHAVLSGLPVITDQERADYLASWSPDIQPDAAGAYLDWAWTRYQRIWSPASPAILNVGATELICNFERYNWAYNAAFRYDPAPGLARLACPMLLFQPEHDILAYTDQRVLAIVPSARYIQVPDLPGQLPIRVPEIYAREVLSFVGA